MALASCAEDMLLLNIGAPPPGFNEYYGKYLDDGGIPILGSSHVSDVSFGLVARIVDHMLSRRPDVRENLIKQHTQVSILGVEEKYTEIPEMRKWKGKTVPIGDRRTFDEVRGGGAVKDNPVTVTCERNLCGIRDPYLNHGFSVTIHEFAHSIQNLGLSEGERIEIRNAYQQALASRLYKRPNGENAYILSDEFEYFAGGTDLWFGTYETVNPWSDPSLSGRDSLRTRDPLLYEILSHIYPNDDWRPPSPPAQ